MNKDQEQTIIKEILKKNGYQQSIIHHKHINKAHKKSYTRNTRNTKRKSKIGSIYILWPENQNHYQLISTYESHNHLQNYKHNKTPLETYK
jgi:hypothetical protein